MKRAIYTLLFICVFAYIKAQQYGIDIGHSIGSNSLKIEESVAERVPLIYKDVSMNQALIPSFFIRPYIRLHKKTALYTGAELSRFKFRCTENIYSSTAGWVPQLYKFNELHIPVGLRYIINDDKTKHVVRVYGGIFARLFVLGKQWINPVNSEPVFTGTPGSCKPRLSYKQKSDKFLNLMIGIQYRLKLKPCFSLNFDLYGKYMPALVNPYPSDVAMIGFPTYNNKFSCYLAIGCSFNKRDKPQEEDASKIFRLE